MIELLNNYRAAKEASEEAANELGRALGAAFEQEYRNVPEFQSEQYDDLTLDRPPTMNNLNQLFMGDAFQRALGGFIRGNNDGTCSVGVCLNNATVSRTNGSHVTLDVAPFVLGFVEGFRQSRSSAGHQRNGSPALAASR